MPTIKTNQFVYSTQGVLTIEYGCDCVLAMPFTLISVVTSQNAWLKLFLIYIPKVSRLIQQESVLKG